MARRRTVITGIGPITCVGIGRENFWRGLLAEKSGIQTISSFDTSEFNAHCGGEIRDWIPEDYFPPHRLKRLDRYAQFAVASARMALDDAGIPYSREKPQDRVGVSFGTALAWPSRPATPDWAFYPDRDAVAHKIQERTPAWKRRSPRAHD